MSTRRRTNSLKTYSRRGNTAAASRLPSTRASSTLLRDTTRSRGSTLSKTTPLQTTAKAAKAAKKPISKKPQTARTKAVAVAVPKRSAAPETTDYDQEDEVVGHNFRRSTKQVLLVTQRPTDASQRLVPERIVQRKTPLKLYAYWDSFGQPREATLGTNLFHIFDIISHDVARGVKVQWEGYGTSDEETTWEPVKKVRDMNADLLHHYLEREGISEGSLLS
ncbi:hypothetical protein LZ30DRAFT_694590 [Colletotrichum cereale]|nr:hypothetical protein LZ30DRAFT_694590 [Colletotrichum cereale]